MVQFIFYIFGTAFLISYLFKVFAPDQYGPENPVEALVGVAWFIVVALIKIQETLEKR